MTIGGDGLLELPARLVNSAEIEPGVAILRENSDRFAIRANCGLGFSPSVKDHRVIVPGGGTVRCCGDDPAVRVLSFREAAGTVMFDRDPHRFIKGQGVHFGPFLLHQVRHIWRKAVSRSRAKAFASRKGECSRRDLRLERSSRRPARSWPPTRRSRRSVPAFPPRSAGGRDWKAMLRPPRPTAVRPQSVTTGTPIASASQLVMPPPKGNGSRATSILRYVSMYCSQGWRPTNSSRSSEISRSARSRATFARQDPGGA